MPKHRYQKTIERIATLINDGKFKPGDKIPPERNLAESFRVSRACIREAIRSLAEKGVLESRLGDGTYVRSSDSDTLKATLEQDIATHRNRLREVFELRMMLEPQIAAHAAKRISPKELDQLKAIVFDQGRAAATGSCDAEFDTRFHMALYKAADNTVVLKIMNTIEDQLEDTRTKHMRSPNRKEASIQGHLKIIEALEKRDAPAAFEAMTAHIRHMRDSVLSNKRKD